MDVMVDGRFLILGVGEVGFLTSASAGESGRRSCSRPRARQAPDLGVPEVSGEVVALLPQLKGYDLMHGDLRHGG